MTHALDEGLDGLAHGCLAPQQLASPWKMIINVSPSLIRLQEPAPLLAQRQYAMLTEDMSRSRKRRKSHLRETSNLRIGPLGSQRPSVIWTQEVSHRCPWLISVHRLPSLGTQHRCADHLCGARSAKRISMTGIGLLCKKTPIITSGHMQQHPDAHLPRKLELGSVSVDKWLAVNL